MDELVNDEMEGRLSQKLEGGEVFALYRRNGSSLVVTHVEADPVLRNTGAAGRFMQAMVDWARANGHSLDPRCGYAVTWFARHPDAGDVLGGG